METLTKRQHQIYEYIKSYIEKKGYSPTYEEIKKKFNLSAFSTVHQHIQTLSEKSFLSKTNNSSRGIALKISEEGSIEIPLLGNITAGKPIEAIEIYEETVSIPRKGIKKTKDYYALRVSGDSMIEDGIFDGDIVVVKKQSVAENGQTVVAIIDDNEATLKKIYREKNRFRLQPANQKILPLYRKEIEIRGVVVKIIRNLEEEKLTTKKYKTLDLFAGIGGIRLGFENAGFETVFANDFDSQCKATYDLNFNRSKLIVEDIKKIGLNDLPEFNFLLAGFPCQAFSIAGYREGFKDKQGRGNLFFDIAKIIKERKPDGFLLENVKNLRGHDKGKTFKIITDTLEHLGYYIKSKIINSADYGNVPQNRERIYIVGFKNKAHFERFSFPNSIPLEKSIRDILEKEVEQKYYYNDKPLFQKIKNYPFSDKTVYQWRRQYIRENKRGICPTLTANMGTGGHNVPIIKDKKGVRKLTPSECLKLQGFPENYKLPKSLPDSALYKQIGNSVTVTVVQRIAQKIKKVIED
jgi:DNA (cytosine-5)-methyltransferase 1